MKRPPDKPAVAADVGRRRPDYVIELAVNPDLRDRARRVSAAQAQPALAWRGKTAEPDPDPPLAER